MSFTVVVLDLVLRLILCPCHHLTCFPLFSPTSSVVVPVSSHSQILHNLRYVPLASNNGTRLSVDVLSSQLHIKYTSLFYLRLPLFVDRLETCLCHTRLILTLKGGQGDRVSLSFIMLTRHLLFPSSRINTYSSWRSHSALFSPVSNLILTRPYLSLDAFSHCVVRALI